MCKRLDSRNNPCSECYAGSGRHKMSCSQVSADFIAKREDYHVGRGIGDVARLVLLGALVPQRVGAHCVVFEPTGLKNDDKQI